MVEIICAIVGLLAGGLSVILFYPQLKAEKSIDNEAKQSAEWQKLYQQERTIVSEKDEKIDALYKQIAELRNTAEQQSTEHRNSMVEWMNENAKLQVEVASLRLVKCEIPKCPNRKPPTGY